MWFTLVWAPNLLALAAVLLLFSAAMPVFGIAALSYRLTVTLDRLQARAGTACSLFAWVASSVGAGLGGLLLAVLSPGLTALVFGVWVLVLALVVTARAASWSVPSCTGPGWSIRSE